MKQKLAVFFIFISFFIFYCPSWCRAIEPSSLLTKPQPGSIIKKQGAPHTYTNTGGGHGLETKQIPVPVHAPQTDNTTAAETVSQKKSSAPAADTPLEAYATATSFIKQAHYEEALPYLEKALQQPDHLFIKADYAVCLAWTGAYQQAADFFGRHEQELKNLTYVTRSVARSFYELGNVEKALDLYQQSLASNPADGEAFKGVMYCLTRLGKYEQAHRRLEEAGKKELIAPHVITLIRVDLLKEEQDYKDAYRQYLHILVTSTDEESLLRHQDKRRQVFGFLSAEDLNALITEYRDQYPAYLILLMDNSQQADLPSSRVLEIQTYSLGALLELAWGYFKAGRHTESQDLYRFILNKWPSSCLARIGLTYPLAAQGQFEDAQKGLQGVLGRGCFKLNALFAQAYVYEQQHNFLAAITTYEKILTLQPKNPAAPKLKIRGISDLGAPSLAYEEALARGITEQEFIEYLTTDLTLPRIKWAQHDKAIISLEAMLRENPANTRARYDYIVALRNKERMPEVLDQFRLLEHDLVVLPYFVTEAVADAYLYLEQPKKALYYYELSYNKKPEFPFYTLMGLFYTYQELRWWKQAEQMWREIRAFMATHQQLSPWIRLEAFQARGWYFAYQDRLKEAQHYFTPMLKKAGMNSATRTALGYVYLWRGWPRLSLEEFKIAQNVDIKEFSANIQNGIVLALNQLNYKNEARELAGKLFKEFPRNKHVQDVVETLQVEDMNEFWIEGKFVNESPGATEYWIRSSLSEPIIPTFRLFQEFVWQETSDDGEDFHWNRAGLGCEWIVLPQLIWKQAVNYDYEDTDDFGYYSIITWLPTDHLKITAGYDSFMLDIPIRARAEGVEGENAYLDVYYHESDLRYYGATFNINWLDDGNRGTSLTLYYDQNVVNLPDFKIRCGIEGNYSANSKQNVDYFSPLEGYTLVLNQTFHYIHYHRDDRKFRSSLYTREGFYLQHGFHSYAIYGITYEQTFDVSKSFAIVWHVAWDRKIYDGDSTHVWSGFFGLRKNF